MLHRQIFHYDKIQNEAGITEHGDERPYQVFDQGGGRIGSVELHNHTRESIEVWLFDSPNDPTGSNSPQIRLRADPDTIVRRAYRAKRFHNGIWADLVTVNRTGGVVRATTLPNGQIFTAVEFTDEAEASIIDGKPETGGR